jgi:hypothetical protein
VDPVSIGGLFVEATSHGTQLTRTVGRVHSSLAGITEPGDGGEGRQTRLVISCSLFLRNTIATFMYRDATAITLNYVTIQAVL